MPRIGLTKSAIDALPTPKSDVVYWDAGSPGFGVKVTPKGRKVFVVLYDMTKEDEKNLDRWEGSEFGVHKKIRCRVERVSSDTTTDPVLAWLYVLDAWEGGVPSARYLGVMADAAEIAGAPADYVHALRTRPSRNIGPGHGD